jgi:phosphatidate cytidylyltransferase
MTETPPAARTADELLTRVTAGIVMAAIACAAAYYGSWPLRALVSAAAIAMLVEWCDMHRVSRRWAIAGGLLLAAILLGGIQYLYPDAPTAPGDELDAEDFLPALTAFAGIAGLGLLFGAATRRIAAGWGFIYVAIPAFALLVLSWAYAGLVFWVMVVTWATDIFAYFAGRAIGGPKLAPRVSPNKTWAGLIGGAAGAGLAGWGIAWLFDLGFPFQWLGALMALVAQAGDLYESWVKRRAGVKDSGTLLPGHGGVLDRLDGLLPVALATLLLLAAGLWTPPPAPDDQDEADTSLLNFAGNQAR